MLCVMYDEVYPMLLIIKRLELKYYYMFSKASLKV